MVERICPACQHGNPLENHYCGACGVPLDRQELARREQGAIVIAGQRIPLAQVRQVSRAAAVGLAALAAEAAIAYLRRRADGPAAPVSLVARPTSAVTPQAADEASRVVTIVSQRVIEFWDQGTLARQIVEKHVWKREG